MAGQKPSWWVPLIVAAGLGFGLSMVKDCGKKDLASAQRLAVVETKVSAVEHAHEDEIKRMDRIEDKLDRIILMVLGEKPAARK